MDRDLTAAGRESEIERLKRELAAYKVAAARVGDHLREISRLNREISRSRREKELLLATTSGPMRLIGRDFRMRWVNSALEKACGRPAGELEGEYCYRALPSADCGTGRCLLKRVLAGGRPAGEEKVIRIAGRDRFYIVSASPFRNSLGEVEGILEDFLDITGRKTAEDALRRSEELYRTFIDAASDIVFVKDENLRYLMVNEANRAFFDRPESEIIGRTDFDLMDPAAAENCRRTDREAVEKDRIVITSEEVGGRIYETRKFPLRLRDGAAGVGAFIRDVTEPRKAEEALRKSERRFSELFKGTRDGIVMVNARGGFIDANRAYCDMLGYTREELLELGDFYRITPERWRKWEKEEIWEKRLLTRGYSGIYEKEYIHKDGHIFPVELQAYAVPGEDGKIEYFWGVARDITERKKSEEDRLELERQVQRAQKLESLGVLAGGIAHDFNNILMVMLGNAELALRELGPLSPARESLNDILHSGREAAELCRQMLSYTGKASLTRVPVDLNSLIGDMGNLVRSSISRKAVLTLNLGESLPPVQGDPSQIRQVVMNLLINASEALEEQSGYITLATSLADCTGEELARSEIGGEPAPGSYLCLEVTDSGKGMDGPTRRRIFEPFFSTKFTGRGLGLVSVLGIVRGHNGALQVESGSDRGSTFRVFLPVFEGEFAPEEEEGPPAVAWRGEGTVLLAEDENKVRSLTVRRLKDLGLDVLEAADGAEAVELYRQYWPKIDLVLLDLTMPGLDGGEVLEEIRRIDPGARVVICSGYSEEDLARRFDRLSPAGVLQKPYSLAKLAGILSLHLPGQGGGQRSSAGRSPGTGS